MKKNEPTVPGVERTAEPSQPQPFVVGIGASAGGLNALKYLLMHTPGDTGLAYVVVVHLSPEHESHMADLLQSNVKMPVLQVNETIKLEHDHVYVIPPGHNLSTIDTHLRLSDLEERRNERAPIDHFFSTLSSTHDGHAIGIILTGTGTDGTLGIRQIKEKGGLTIVQDPGEAEYDGMPRSAISTGFVDMILPLAEIPEAILRYVHTKPRVTVPEDGEDLEDEPQQLLQMILAEVRTRTSRDFSRYKRSTIMRRVHRRMQIRYVEDFELYLDLLRKDPGEVNTLGEDLLITVTSFFRDPEVYAKLQTAVVPELFKGKGQDDCIRVWSVGCATGEEAYSLAILLIEEAERREAPTPRLKVFASDLHEQSISMARDGFYPGEIDVSPERLRRFFYKENGGYRINKEVRELIVFAPHNLLYDPPFSKLDLIVCRNVLIYLQRDVHHEIIELFHYALNPDRFLVLGTAETIDHSELFQLENKPLRLYRKRTVPASEPRLPVFPHIRTYPPHTVRPGEHPEPVAYGALYRRMIERYGPANMLVNPADKVVYLSENARRYLRLPRGELISSAFKLVREELRTELRTVMHHARERKQPARSKPVMVLIDGNYRRVIVDVAPSLEPGQEGFTLVIFSDWDVPQDVEQARNAAGTMENETLQQVRAELDLTKQRLEVVIDEYESTREDMYTSNEELYSANEELRATMEELETSKEELQSTNEELQAINEENRHKVEELAQLSSDLQNLLVATEIATLFLDRELRILRFTPKVGELFNIRPSDRSRPITDLTSRLGYSELQSDAERVLQRFLSAEREVQDDTGRWYLTRMFPYRLSDDRIDGVVLTFFDITGLKQAERDLHQAKTYAESIIDTLHEPIIVLRPDLHIVSVNQAFYKHFDVRPDETINHLIFDLGDGQWNIPELRRLLEDVLPENNVFNDFKVVHDFENVGRRVMLLNARRLDHVQLILLGIRDVTEQMQAVEALHESEARFRAIAELVPDLLWRTEPVGNTTWVNHRWMEYTGQSLEDASSYGWLEAIHPDERMRSRANFQEAIDSEQPFQQEHRIRSHEGSYRWFLLRAIPVRDEEGCIKQWFGAATDVDEQRTAFESLSKLKETLEARVAERTLTLKLTNEILEQRNRELQDFAYVASHDMQEPLRKIQTFTDLIQNDFRQQLGDEGVMYLDRLQKAAERMSRIISDLLAFSRITSRQQPFTLTSVKKVMQLVLADLDLAISDSNAIVEVEGDAPLEADTGQLTQLLNHLVYNAIKFRREDVTPKIHVNSELVGSEDPMCRIVVEDNGIGLESRFAEKIFRPFARLHGKSKYAGTGMGLAISHRIVEQHGGKIWVESTPGEGSRFIIELPSRQNTRSGSIPENNSEDV